MSSKDILSMQSEVQITVIRLQDNPKYQVCENVERHWDMHPTEDTQLWISIFSGSLGKLLNCKLGHII